MGLSLKLTHSHIWRVYFPFKKLSHLCCEQYAVLGLSLNSFLCADKEPLAISFGLNLLRRQGSVTPQFTQQKHHYMGFGQEWQSEAVETMHGEET